MNKLISPHGGYRELKSFQHAELVYDSTVKFCDRLQVVRRLAYEKNRSYPTYRPYIETSPPEVAANTIICLIHQTNYLLDQQLRQLEKAFLEEGGFTERLYHARSTARRRKP